MPCHKKENVVIWKGARMPKKGKRYAVVFANMPDNVLGIYDDKKTAEKIIKTHTTFKLKIREIGDVI